MIEFASVIPFTYAALFPMLNPLAGAMIFLNLTQGLPQESLGKLATKVGINTFILLVVVLLTGSWILQFFGITIPIVQVGGGIVVATLAWKLLNQPTTTKTEESKMTHTDKDINEMAFFPLTMPLTAGPGCIAVTLTIGAHEIHKSMFTTVMSQCAAIIGILLASITVWICYRYADNLRKKLGNSGTRVIMRLSAFINLCIGLQIMWHGVQGLLVGVL